MSRTALAIRDAREESLMFGTIGTLALVLTMRRRPAARRRRLMSSCALVAEAPGDVSP